MNLKLWAALQIQIVNLCASIKITERQRDVLTGEVSNNAVYRSQFPTLICPQYHDNITMVSEDNKDIMDSRLLCSRSIALEYKELFGQNRQQLVVVEDILREVTEPPTIIVSSDPLSKETLANLPSLIKAFEQTQHQEQAKFQYQQQQLRDQLKKRVEHLGEILTQSGSTLGLRQLVDNNAAKLKQAIQSDPLVAADIPKPAQALAKIQELKASTDLPNYLFGLLKKQRTWKQHATPQLLEWKNQQEIFYRDRLHESLNQTYNNQNYEQAKAFFDQQFDQIAQQVQQILQEEANSAQVHYLNLVLNSAASLTLITNEMITPETKLVYQITSDISGQGQSIHDSLQGLNTLQNIEIQFDSSNKNGQDLTQIVKGLLTMKQLKVLVLSAENLSNEYAKSFFGELSKSQDAFPNLLEVDLQFGSQIISKEAAQQVIKALNKLGGASVTSLNIDFSGCQLTHEFGATLGQTLQAFKGLRSLKIDLGGYSLKSNDLKDKGAIPIIQSLVNFADHLSSLHLNLSYNGLTDLSLVAFHQTFSSSKWPRLKNLDLVLQKNEITEYGVKKLAKSVKSLTILLKFQLNLNSNKIDLQSVRQLIQQLPAYLQVQKICIRGCGLNDQDVQEFIETNKLQNKLII